MPPNGDEEPALRVAGLATSIAKEYQASGGDVVDLFAAFAGLVFYKDSTVGCEALSALENGIKMRASGGGEGCAAPSA